MSEQDREPDVDFTAPDERDEPDESGNGDDEQADQTSAQAADLDGSEELVKKATRATENYHKRIETLLGPDPNRHECRTCDGLGFVYGDEARERKLKHPPQYVTCEVCDGEGAIETGSKNPLHVEAICTACNATGFIIRPTQAENVTPITQPATTAAASVMGYQQPDGTFVPLVQPQNPQQYGSG